jgi:hypothetical protein
MLHHVSLYSFPAVIALLVPAAGRAHAAGAPPACAEAIEVVRQGIADDRGLDVTVHWFDVRNAYESGYPEAAPHGVSFSVAGESAEAFMLDAGKIRYAQAAIESCSVLSMVTLGLFETDWIDTYGVIGEQRQASPFECVDPGQGVEISWGQTYCL